MLNGKCWMFIFPLHLHMLTKLQAEQFMNGMNTGKFALVTFTYSLLFLFHFSFSGSPSMDGSSGKPSCSIIKGGSIIICIRC